MRNRLAIFVFALLLLPPLAVSLSGQEWIAPQPIAGAVWLPSLAGMLAALAFALLFDMLTFRRTGHSLLHAQRTYLFWCALAGAVTGVLLAYLNLFAESWLTPAAPEAAALLLTGFCGALGLPAVLISRLWLAGLPGLVRLSTRRFALPDVPAQAAATLSLLAALVGLLAGPVWVEPLGWLLWLSPLLLLVALQLLWHESTVFSGLPQGDWSRLLLGSIAGIMVGGIALATYRFCGGAIYFTLGGWRLIAGLSVFGLLCLQLGDVIAENWRGKKRGNVSKRKPFPIPVVTKKD